MNEQETIYTIGEEDTRFSIEFSSYPKARKTFIEMTSNYNRMNIPEINKKKMQLFQNFDLLFEVEVKDFSRHEVEQQLHQIEDKLHLQWYEEGEYSS